jgi:hypothetical protein
MLTGLGGRSATASSLASVRRWFIGRPALEGALGRSATTISAEQLDRVVGTASPGFDVEAKEPAAFLDPGYAELGRSVFACCGIVDNAFGHLPLFLALPIRAGEATGLFGESRVVGAWDYAAWGSAIMRPQRRKQPQRHSSASLSSSLSATPVHPRPR